MWRLSNLSSQNDVVSLFLFDKAFDKHWKTSTGTIITVLNPKIQADKQVGVNIPIYLFEIHYYSIVIVLV